MNRRQKIIVSVTGIFLVLLLLVGLTYAYFLTKINGNENSKSISISTANLALVYGDGNGIITGSNIMPGSTLDSKTFTVSNEGNDTTDYVVVIEDVKVTNVSDSSTTTFESNDFVYTLTCTEGCAGVDNETPFPITGGILVGNSIEVGVTQTYELIVTYKETGLDQSNDMNKSLEAKVNIADISTINPYSSDTSSLAYNIINNAVALTNEEKSAGYAELVATPKTKVAEEISAEDESVLSITLDDYGMSYYYRGTVENNYLEFNNMCWRIVRIEGDGSIKITLAAQKKCSEITESDTGTAFIGTGDYGYITDSNGNNYADYENSENRTTSMKYKFNEWYTINLSSVSDKLKTTSICLGDTTTKYDGNGLEMTQSDLDAQYEENGYNWWYFDNYKRLIIDKIASLVCNTNGERTSNTQIYPLTIDEVVFAGGKVNVSNNQYYLVDNTLPEYWWTLSPAHFTGTDILVFDIYDGIIDIYDGYVSYNYVNLRPAVSLISGTQFDSGDGSINSPYTIK